MVLMLHVSAYRQESIIRLKKYLRKIKEKICLLFYHPDGGFLSEPKHVTLKSYSIPSEFTCY